MTLDISCNGIVIRAYASGESDLVLRIVSEHDGKISAIAKHARKSRKRFSSSLDILDKGEFRLRPTKGSLFTITGFNAAPSFGRIRDNLWKLSVASLLCECCDFLLPEGGSGDSLYHVLVSALTEINQCSEPKETLKAGFLALAAMLVATGFLDPDEAGTAGAHNLLKLIGLVENCAERKLLSKAEVLSLVETLRERSPDTAEAR